MDGSSEPFVKLIEGIGIEIQNKKRKILKVKKELTVSNNNGYVKLIPNNQFSIDFEIDFPSKLVSKQSCQLQLVNGNYKTDIASTSNEIVNAIISGSNNDFSPNKASALCLYVMYLKRIAAHSRNLVSSVVNPFERIGYPE